LARWGGEAKDLLFFHAAKISIALQIPLAKIHARPDVSLPALGFT